MFKPRFGGINFSLNVCRAVVVGPLTFFLWIWWAFTRRKDNFLQSFSSRHINRQSQQMAKDQQTQRLHQERKLQLQGRSSEEENKENMDRQQEKQHDVATPPDSCSQQRQSMRRCEDVATNANHSVSDKNSGKVQMDILQEREQSDGGHNEQNRLSHQDDDVSCSSSAQTVVTRGINDDDGGNHNSSNYEKRRDQSLSQVVSSSSAREGKDTTSTGRQSNLLDEQQMTAGVSKEDQEEGTEEQSIVRQDNQKLSSLPVDSLTKTNSSQDVRSQNRRGKRKRKIATEEQCQTSPTAGQLGNAFNTSNNGITGTTDGKAKRRKKKKVAGKGCTEDTFNPIKSIYWTTIDLPKLYRIKQITRSCLNDVLLAAISGNEMIFVIQYDERGKMEDMIFLSEQELNHNHS